jgi:putative transposase
MNENNIIEFPSSNEFSGDALTELLRIGSKRLIYQAIEAELSVLLNSYQHEQDERGHRRLVRNGYHPARKIQTGIGPVEVQVPRVRDRKDNTLKFTPSFLPPYLRRTKNIEELLPVLYLKGVSTGDFSEALSALLGKDAPGLSSGTISKLKEIWQEEYTQWASRSLEFKRYVYFWVDGIYLSTRLERENQCLLVIIGADEMGKKELVAVTDGGRECEISWKELLLDLKRRGLTVSPELAIGDGGLGFWKALPQVYPSTRKQRCWVHKSHNVLTYLPSSLQGKARIGLQNIWMAPSYVEAIKAFDAFIETYGAKYPKATDCLEKDRQALLAFYDFPAEHWIHLRTTNPIESMFATIRQRTDKTKGCLSRKTCLAMVFKLAKSAEKNWRKMTGANQIAQVIQGVKFKDGVKITDQNTTSGYAA